VPASAIALRENLPMLALGTGSVANTGCGNFTAISDLSPATARGGAAGRIVPAQGEY